MKHLSWSINPWTWTRVPEGCKGKRLSSSTILLVLVHCFKAVLLWIVWPSWSYMAGMNSLSSMPPQPLKNMQRRQLWKHGVRVETSHSYEWGLYIWACINCYIFSSWYCQRPPGALESSLCSSPFFPLTCLDIPVGGEQSESILVCIVCWHL